MQAESMAVQSVKDMPDGGKRWLEAVLGQHLTEDQQVFVMAFRPSAQIPEGSLSEFDALLDEFAADLALVSLPPDFSREDIYAGRD